MMKIGTSGFRGVMGEEFTKDNVCKIMQVASDIILKLNLKKKVFIGYDNRFMSEIYAQWATEVLVGNGIDVEMSSSSVPSPLVSYVGKLFNNDISIMITASHNPYYYNGIKIFSKDGKDLDLALEKMFSKGVKEVKKYEKYDFSQAKKEKKVTFADYTEQYVNSIISLLKFNGKFKVKSIFDVMNGSSLDAVNLLKKKLGLNATIINENRDVFFTTGAPIPSEDNLQNLKKLARKKSVNFAFATDGDGDRMGVIDDKGNFLCGNELATLIYYFAIKEKGLKGPFIKNYSFSLLADKVCKYFGETVYETKIGFKHIGKKLIEKNAILGAENSGCEFNNHAYTKDGLAVYCLLLEIVNFYHKPLSKIVDDMKKEVGYSMKYKEVSFRVRDKKKIEETLKEKLPSFNKGIKNIGKLDGTKIIFEDDSWLLIRFSGTENLIRLVCEANSEKELKETLKIAQDFVEEI